jgi:hypothetical protein
LRAIRTQTSSSSAPKLSLDFGFARFALFFSRVARVLGDSLAVSLLSGSGDDCLALTVGLDFRLMNKGDSDMSCLWLMYDHIYEPHQLPLREAKHFNLDWEILEWNEEACSNCNQKKKKRRAGESLNR